MDDTAIVNYSSEPVHRDAHGCLFHCIQDVKKEKKNEKYGENRVRNHITAHTTSCIVGLTIIPKSYNEN